MKKTLFLTGAVMFMTAFGSTVQSEEAAPAPKKINAIVDLSHSFSFYGDGRFFGQYMPNQAWARNLASLKVLDPVNANANMLLLLGADWRVPYTAEDAKILLDFVKSGGLAFISTSPNDKTFRTIAKALNADIVDNAVKAPLKATADLQKFTGMTDIEIITRGGGGIIKADAGLIKWTPLITDAANNAVMMLGKIDKGTVILANRSLIGQQPDAKDNINAPWLSKLIPAVTLKTVDPAHGPKGRDFSNQDYRSVSETGVIFHYNEYLKHTFQAMKDIEAQCRPMIEKRMGVPLVGKNASEIALLSTDGGGFSSGPLVALAVFWGDFPERKDGMVEFITHESVHSWVHPFVEIWNEAIATYVGDLVMCDMGYPEEGMRRINGQIQAAKNVDPNMDAYDLNGDPLKSDGKALDGGQKRDLHWGKTFWIFEEMRKIKPNALALYFQAKRKYADPSKIKGYGPDETVAVWSFAMGKDMFPWFNQHGVKADKAKSQIKYP